MFTNVATLLSKFYIIIIFNLRKVLNCHAEKNAYSYYGFTVSKSCNPEFKDLRGNNCTYIAENDWCKLGSEPGFFLILDAVPNKDLMYETALQYPQCGCGADGALSLQYFDDAY